MWCACTTTSCSSDITRPGMKIPSDAQQYPARLLRRERELTLNLVDRPPTPPQVFPRMWESLWRRVRVIVRGRHQSTPFCLLGFTPHSTAAPVIPDLCRQPASATFDLAKRTSRWTVCPVGALCCLHLSDKVNCYLGLSTLPSVPRPAEAGIVMPMGSARGTRVRSTLSIPLTWPAGDGAAPPKT